MKSAANTIFTWLILFLTATFIEAAPIPRLYNTGVNDAGALLPAGSIDPHYRLVASPDGSGPNAFVVNEGFPIPPWLANGPSSKWIGPQANQGTGNAPGDYRYRIIVDLTGLEPSTAVITGRWSSDNAGAGIFINGVATGITYDGNFGAFSQTFTINSGFIDGTNTLDFVVNNGAPGVNPTGFRAEISGSADTILPPNTPPSVTEHPVSQTNGIGESVTFSVKAIGGRPLRYQWRHDGTPLTGETNTTLVLPALRFEDAGTYDVIVSNVAGTVTSNPATLTVVVLSQEQLSYEPLGPSSRRTGLAFSEIMYHPRDRDDALNLEFVEIYNSNPFAEDLSGYRISGDVDYVFPAGTSIPGLGFIVVATVPADVEQFYGISGVLGGFTNNLPNSSGTLRLRKKSDTMVLELTYSDEPPWPVAADGAGHSLVLAHASYGEANPKAWAASAFIGGSPGAGDPVPSGPLENVMINEIRAHTDDPVPDFVELYNYNPVSVDISGCFLTDERNTNKFRIPDNTILLPGGFIDFDQNELGFALGADGETVYFVNAAQTRVIEAVRYNGQANGISSGRTPDGDSAFRELLTASPGTSNSPPLIRPIVINEIMYNPLSGDGDDEYVELYNRSGSAINISGWRLQDGISFTFPANTVIGANSYLVAVRDTVRFMSNYPGVSPSRIAGNFNGNLANDGERIALAMPETLIETNGTSVTTNTYYIVVDEVEYVDGGRWGKWADGGGSSLELIDANSDNRLPSNWADSDETAKAPWTLVEFTGALDHPHPQYATADQLQVFLQGAGEALVDDVEVLPGTNANRIANSTFESGITGWVPQGTQRLSSWGTAGYNSARSLHLRASDRGDHVANRVRTPLTPGIPAGGTATIRAKVRWLAGHPEILMRLRGNHLEAASALIVPQNLGTPGAPNSRAIVNAAPAITEVSHRPVLPQQNQPIRVMARVHDSTGILSVVGRYRVDPSPNFSPITMLDDGTGADYMAGDGVFTGIIPGQAAGNLIAFHIEARDALNALNVFPTSAPSRECLVRVGETMVAGGFATYRFWLTKAGHDFWGSREKMSNEGIDCTFVYGPNRVVYNAEGHYSGSSYTAPIYNTPTGALCGYDLEFPEDDTVLGEDHFTLDWPIRDDTNQREQLMYWFLEQYGLPNMYRRYVHLFVNGVRRGTIYDDVQQPSNETVEQWFPDDPDGHLIKTDCWNEFTDAGDRVDNCVLNYLEVFNTTGGVKKTARYRWNWRPRAVQGSANDFSDIFTLVDAVNAQGTGYQQALQNFVDVEHWMKTFCMNDLASFWDAFGNPNSKNTYLYKPENDKWKLMCWDFDVGLGVFNDPPTDPLFPSNVDPAIMRMYASAGLVRAYWRALDEALNGFFQAQYIDPILDAKYAAFQANGVGLNSPAAIKSWISQRRTYLTTQLGNFGNVGFTVTTPSPSSTNRNLATINGVASVRIKTITVNSNTYPVTWNTVTNWSIRVPLRAGENLLLVQGLGAAGNVLGSQTISFTYTGADESAEAVVINEIMYNPLVPEASYVELWNTSANYTFDLSNWRLNGIDYNFSGGTILPSGQFLVIAKNPKAFVTAHGANIPVLGPFNGQLDDGGETLTLLQPGASPGESSIVDRVTYDDDPPWYAAADGQGAALQLIDASQDNNRVSNWSDGAGWQYFKYTATVGASPGSRLSFFFETQGGDVYLDDFFFSIGSTSEAGTNNLRNPGFEEGLAPWVKSGLGSASSITTSYARSGTSSLHLVVAPGSQSLTTFYQDIAGLVANTNYTLSFWYLPGSAGTNLNARLNSLYRTSLIPRPIRATPGTTNSVVASIASYEPLWLSEVQPENISGLQDNAGEREPWIEIYNSGPTSLNLSNYALAIEYGSLLQWQFPATATIQPGEFKLIWADAETGETTAAHLHANFRLNPTNGSVILSRVVGGAARIVDYINYRNVPADRSVGSYPDGQLSLRQQFTYPTPGGTNNPASPPLAIFVNEWMAANTSIADPMDGDPDDWFELFNPNTNRIDLTGYTLTDDVSRPRKHVVPSGITIPPLGFLLVWADEESGQTRTNGDLHVNFRLGASGESIAIYDPSGREVDRIDFLQQTNDVSQGRYPDGAAPLHFMITPTPKASNVIPAVQITLFSPELEPGPSVKLTWTAESGATYRVRYKTNLHDLVWETLAGNVTASGGTATKTDSNLPTGTQRYYRIERIQP